MIVNNGRQRRLIVEGVFDGLCGENGGVLAFIPNRAGKAPEQARGGLLDGNPVRVTIVKGEGAFYSASWEPLA